MGRLSGTVECVPALELKMGETGEGSLEPGDASGEIFWMRILMPKPKDVEDAVGKRDDHKSTGRQETVSKADDRVEGFPHLLLDRVHG